MSGFGPFSVTPLSSLPTLDGTVSVVLALSVGSTTALSSAQVPVTVSVLATAAPRLTGTATVPLTVSASASGQSYVGVPVANGFSWRQDATGQQELLVVAGGTLFTTSYGTFPWTWTAQTGSLSNAVTPTFAQFRDGSDDVVYIGDGGQLNKWDGTTLTTDIAGTIGAQMITVHNQRLWSCGCGAAPDSIFYSALNDGDTLGNGGAGGGEIIVRTFGDENVTSLLSIGTSLLIFHRRGVSRLTGYGQDDILVEPQGITADVGLIAPNSPIAVGNIGFFVSERGLYRCNEAEVAPVGTVETPDPLLAQIRRLSAAQFAAIRTEFNRATRELWIAMPGAGVYTYHTILQAWSGPWDAGYVAPATTALFGVLDGNGLPVVLKGDAAGFVSLCDAPVALDIVAADGSDGIRYTMVVQLHRLYAGDDALAKSLRWGYLTAKLNGSTACSVAWDTGTDALTYTVPVSSSSLWGVGTWSGATFWGGPSSQNLRIPMGGTGYYTDVKILDTSAQQPVFSRFQLEAFAMGRR